MTIILSGLLSASNSDILQGTRLQTVPANGVLMFEFQASDADATNNYSVSVQLPGGDTPMESVLIPCGNSTGLAGVLDMRTKLQATFPVGQGGHAVVGVTLTGTAEVIYRITYQGVGR